MALFKALAAPVVGGADTVHFTFKELYAHKQQQSLVAAGTMGPLSVWQDRELFLTYLGKQTLQSLPRVPPQRQFVAKYLYGAAEDVNKLLARQPERARARRRINALLQFASLPRLKLPCLSVPMQWQLVNLRTLKIG